LDSPELKLEKKFPEVFQMPEIGYINAHGDILKQLYADDLLGKYRAAGREEGRREERLRFAKSLLSRNTPLEDIAELTGLARDEIEALR
jgi:hypothetical protein